MPDFTPSPETMEAAKVCPDPECVCRGTGLVGSLPLPGEPMVPEICDGITEALASASEAFEAGRQAEQEKLIHALDLIASLCRDGRAGKVPDSGNLEYGEQMAEAYRPASPTKGGESE